MERKEERERERKVEGREGEGEEWDRCYWSLIGSAFAKSKRRAFLKVCLLKRFLRTWLQ